MTLDPIDRLSPCQRPQERQVMWQRWHQLTFLHWALPPERIAPLLPPGLTLDTFDGMAWVGLVPFTMTGVRPVGLPAVPPLSSFHETNVRTYVHHEGREPGVWFFSLDAASSVAVRLARALFHLPYHRSRMLLGERTQPDEITYESERLWPSPVPARCRVRTTPIGEPSHAAPGTIEHFLLERYVLYAKAQRGLVRGRVHHPPYPVQRAQVHEVDETLLSAAGIERPPSPPLAHFARTMDVRIYGLSRVGS